MDDKTNVHMRRRKYGRKFRTTSFLKTNHTVDLYYKEKGAY